MLQERPYRDITIQQDKGHVIVSFYDKKTYKGWCEENTYFKGEKIEKKKSIFNKKEHTLFLGRVPRD